MRRHVKVNKSRLVGRAEQQSLDRYWDLFGKGFKTWRMECAELIGGTLKTPQTTSKPISDACTRPQMLFSTNHFLQLSDRNPQVLSQTHSRLAVRDLGPRMADERYLRHTTRGPSDQPTGHLYLLVQTMRKSATTLKIRGLSKRFSFYFKALQPRKNWTLSQGCQS